MIRNLFILVLFTIFSSLLVSGQTQDPKNGSDAAPQTFAFSFDGDGSYLGVQTNEVTKDNFASLGLRDVRGVAIGKVIENSPAHTAGLQAGDVIYKFNGEEITGTRKLTRLIAETAPDHQVKMQIFRNGSTQDITVTLGKRPTPKFENGNFTFAAPFPMGAFPNTPGFSQLPAMPTSPGGVLAGPGGRNRTFVWRTGPTRQIGVGITPLTKQLGDYFGISDGNGLLINSVHQDSPAAKAGLKAGDVIVAVDGKAVTEDLDMGQTISEKKEGDIELTYVRDRGRQTVRLTPETVKNDMAPFMTAPDGEGQRPAMIAPGSIQLGPLTPGAVVINAPGRVL